MSVQMREGAGDEAGGARLVDDPLVASILIAHACRLGRGDAAGPERVPWRQMRSKRSRSSW
jgi:hypothetical protein